MFSRLRLASSHDLRRFADLSEAPLDTREALLWSLTFAIRDSVQGAADREGFDLNSTTVRDAVSLIAEAQHGGWLVSANALLRWVTSEGFQDDCSDVGAPIRYMGLAGTPCLTIAKEGQTHGDPR